MSILYWSCIFPKTQFEFLNILLHCLTVTDDEVFSVTDDEVFLINWYNCFGIYQTAKCSLWGMKAPPQSTRQLSQLQWAPTVQLSKKVMTYLLVLQQNKKKTVVSIIPTPSQIVKNNSFPTSSFLTKEKVHKITMVLI